MSLGFDEVLRLTYTAGRSNIHNMIKSFRCKHTKALFEGESPRQFRALREVVERKLTMLDCAQTLDFLRSPPGNQLEKLKGDRTGQHSIRVNRQWRICFVWENGHVNDVEIVDYH